MQLVPFLGSSLGSIFEISYCCQCCDSIRCILQVSCTMSCMLAIVFQPRAEWRVMQCMYCDYLSRYIQQESPCEPFLTKFPYMNVWMDQGPTAAPSRFPAGTSDMFCPWPYGQLPLVLLFEILLFVMYSVCPSDIQLFSIGFDLVKSERY